MAENKGHPFIPFSFYLLQHSCPLPSAFLWSRDSLPLYVVTKRDEGWQIEGLLNTRKLTLERQFFLDDFDSLSAEAQRQVTDLVVSLKQRHQADQSKEI